MKSSNSKRIKEEYKLYALGVVIVLLAVAVAILAWAEGNLRTTFIFGAVAVVSGVGIFLKARSTFRCREAKAIHHAAERTPRRRYVILFIRILALFQLLYGIVNFAIALVKDKPLYIILETVLVMIIGGGLLLFIPLLIDE